MKSKKAKIEKKPSKKSEKRFAKKELESSITDKFLDVIRGFGHEAGNFTKDVKKLSKQLAKKLADKVSSFTENAETPKKAIKKQPAPVETRVKRAVKAPGKSVARAEKIAAKKNTTAASAGKSTSVMKVAPTVKVGRAPARTAGSATAKPAQGTAAPKGGVEKPTRVARKTTAKPNAQRNAEIKSAAPTVRKPRVKRVTTEKSTAIAKKGDATQNQVAAPNLDRTNNTETL